MPAGWYIIELNIHRRLETKLMDEEKLSFEEALGRLEELVNKLEDGNLPLEESLQLFAEGIKLTRYCSNYLEEAEKKIAIIMEDSQGNPVIREEEL